MKKVKLFAAAAVSLALCACSPRSETVGSAEPRVEAVKFYETLALEEGEEAYILSARGDELLVSVYASYPPESPYFREEGYSFKSSSIFIFNVKTGEKSEIEEITGDLFVSSGALTDYGFAYISLDMAGYVPSVPGRPCRLTLRKAAEQDDIHIDLGRRSADGSIDPRLCALDNGNVAYIAVSPASYFEFQIMIAKPDGETVCVASFEEEDGVMVYDCALQSDGERFIFSVAYADAASGSAVWIGDERGITERIVIEEASYVTFFAPLSDSLLISYSVNDDDPMTETLHKMEVVDYSGQNAVKSDGDYVRLQSNLEDTVIGIDLHWKPHLLRVTDEGVTVTRLSLPAEPVSFYPVDANSFYVHYNALKRHGDEDNRALYLLSF
ncbi:MAG: hypothetical protein LBC78_02270 [Oscillospiraceae bacterium]|jgi:hypothetical protein|nr:hypothetical protein [Oscillospiraceae bacterium]